MGKAFINTLVWAAIVFVLMALINYFMGIESWFMNTLNWVFPSALGYFLGYCRAKNIIKEIIS